MTAPKAPIAPKIPLYASQAGMTAPKAPIAPKIPLRAFLEWLHGTEGTENSKGCHCVLSTETPKHRSFASSHSLFFPSRARVLLSLVLVGFREVEKREWRDVKDRCFGVSVPRPSRRRPRDGPVVETV
jgi:hypothetical protein